MGDEKIAIVVKRAQKFWLATMVISALLIGLNFSPFYLVFLVPLGVFLYVIALLASVKYLQHTLTVADFPEDHMAKVNFIAEKMQRGELKPGDPQFKELAEAGILVTTIQASSEPIGTYDGKPMYEWVDILELGTQTVNRYNYHSIAQADPMGLVGLPLEKGKLFALVEGCVYVRDLTST